MASFPSKNGHTQFEDKQLSYGSILPWGSQAHCTNVCTREGETLSQACKGAVRIVVGGECLSKEHTPGNTFRELVWFIEGTKAI